MQLPEWVLEMGRDQIRTALVDECEVVETTDSENDEYAGVIPGTETRTPYPCLFERLSGREAEDAARVNDTAEYKLTLPYGAQIQQSGQVAYKGRTFEVVGLMEGSVMLSTIAFLAGGAQ